MNLGYSLPGAQRMIVERRKLHTMRDDPHNRWKPGLTIHHHTGRYKTHFCFLIDKCESVQSVVVIFDQTFYKIRIAVDRRRLTRKEVATLIHNDGFDCEADFINWFFPLKKGVRPRTMWAGKLIHWTPLKY